MRPVIGITADRNGDASVLKDGYCSAVRRHGGVPLALVSPAEPPRAEGDSACDDEASQLVRLTDGLLLTGGADLLPEFYGESTAVPPGTLRFADARRSVFELALIRESLKQKKPVLAICYGMQLMNVAFGGSLFQDILCQVPGALDHREGMHTVRILRPPGGLSRSEVFREDCRCRVNSTHHQAVKTLGEKLDVFAAAEDGIVEGLFMRDHPFFIGVQWHPERSLSEPSSAELFYHFISAAAAGSRRRRERS